MKSLVIATHNQGKLREMRELLAPLGLDVSCAGDYGLPEPEETGSSFAMNAQIKAQATMLATGLPALADDSGLAVAALGGAPGIYSARWAGEQKDFAAAMARIERELGDKPSNAAFICALCLCLPDGAVQHFEGRVDGALTFPPRGDKGFGYDPIFIPNGESRTFAQMTQDEKHAISHRAKAFSQFIAIHLKKGDS